MSDELTPESEALLHMPRDEAVVLLLREAVELKLDGAGFWEADVRRVMGWPAMPAALPPESPSPSDLTNTPRP